MFCRNSVELKLAHLDNSMEYLQDIFPLSGAVNLYHSLAIFSRQQIDDIFLIFPKKTGFDISCKLSP